MTLPQLFVVTGLPFMKQKVLRGRKPKNSFLDSLLKNIKGVYNDIILGDAADWLTAVYNIFDKTREEDEKACLKKGIHGNNSG